MPVCRIMQPPKRGRGAPRNPIRADLRCYYASSNKTAIDNVHEHSEAKSKWLLRCGRHYTLKSSHAVHKNAVEALNCKRCGQSRIAASSHERHAYACVAAVYMGEWMTEIRVLKGTYGAVDMYLPAVHLAIMVDGRQHFPGNKGSTFREQDVTVQVQRDDRFNTAAVQQHLRVLRLHYDNEQSWHTQIACAVQEAKNTAAGTGWVRKYSWQFRSLKLVSLTV